MDVPVAANVLGTLGALIPQIVVNYRRHNATGLQPSMMMLWAWAGVPLGVYNIVKEYNIALRIQPQILTFLSLVTWIQCYYYERKWSVYRSLLVVLPIAAVMGGIQAGLIIALRIPESKDIEWPMILMASLSAALLAAGPELDYLGIVIYATEFVLWCGVFAAGGYYNFLPWIKKRWSTRESKRVVGQEFQSSGGSREGDNGITLHENPSSSSVFRTASGNSGLRARNAQGRDPQDVE
ncbi:uncharacterized protein NECHADRAFT_40306 [Fusarium vanettenii 77-13-4]|uniref:PQ loop repeat protein n=1 Tax=Fusarium vanettenii (strain ATCC MYA-4622 / CBS 123669 / FGSC 9596 / NRRL 45880 / 77-13-4) TaxID=660122 RepID=C7Z0P1_FUSV7|nr:uncharacterized protein NECHADRAFT_40306 [Fusarium vanettenii 77-13-4]EEU42416.1 hypothetical protein NECHADRAFT_40306 [Fusarium vanettenii 77-13-4]